MSWVLLDDNFPNHPKTVQAGRDAAWLYVCALCYCRRFNTGGFVPRQAIPTLGAGGNTRKMVDALVGVGLWDIAEDGWNIHDYEGFYADDDDKAQRQDAISRKRSEAGKRGAEAKRSKTEILNKQNPSFATTTGGSGLGGDLDHLLLEEKKREADFGNFWAAYPRKDGKQAARTEWMRLKPSDEQQQAIAADLERRRTSTQWLKDGGQFIPHARTYLHQRRWEDGFEEAPRLSERTINVIKGFGAA